MICIILGKQWARWTGSEVNGGNYPPNKELLNTRCPKNNSCDYKWDNKSYDHWQKEERIAFLFVLNVFSYRLQDRERMLYGKISLRLLDLKNNKETMKSKEKQELLHLKTLKVLQKLLKPHNFGLKTPHHHQKVLFSVLHKLRQSNCSRALSGLQTALKLSHLLFHLPQYRSSPRHESVWSLSFIFCPC